MSARMSGHAMWVLLLAGLHGMPAMAQSAHPEHVAMAAMALPASAASAAAPPSAGDETDHGMAMPATAPTADRADAMSPIAGIDHVAMEAPAATASTSMDQGGMQHADMDHAGMGHSGMGAATAVSGMAGMDMSDRSAAASASPISTHNHAMAGMEMPAAPAANAGSAPISGKTGDGMTMPTAGAGGHAHDMSSMDRMKGMAGMNGTDQAAMPGMAPAVMSMGRMQGGRAPAGARSPDYSDGIAHSTMPGMDMVDDAPIGMLLVDQLEAYHGRDGNGQSWELQGWYGNDANKLLLRSEGERSAGRVEDGDIEALWSHAIATYWDTTLGLRHQLGEGPRRDWLAFGIQGLAPYWFELEATAYVGPSGHTAVRLRADYDVLFTQRLILQPELELNLYGRDDPARRVGAGLADVQWGLRLRYEVRREFAPYVGVQFVRRLGRTADFGRADGGPVLDRQFVAGLRFWF